MALVDKYGGKSIRVGLISKYIGNKAKKSRRGLNMLRHPDTRSERSNG